MSDPNDDPIVIEYADGTTEVLPSINEMLAEEQAILNDPMVKAMVNDMLKDTSWMNEP